MPFAKSDPFIATLNNLIATCKDRQYGYQAAASAVRNQELQVLFHTYEQQSALYAVQLQQEVQCSGGQPENSGSVTGWFLRGWLNLKAVISGGEESAIITECLRSEEAALSNYQHAQVENLPPTVQTLVARQTEGVQESHMRLRALEAASAGVLNATK